MDLDDNNAQRRTAASGDRTDRFGRVVHLDDQSSSTPEETPVATDGSGAGWSPDDDSDSGDGGDRGGAGADRVGDEATSSGSERNQWSTDDTSELAATAGLAPTMPPVSSQATSDAGLSGGLDDLGLDESPTVSSPADALGAAGAGALAGEIVDVVPSRIEIVSPPAFAPASTTDITLWTSPRPATETLRRRRRGLLIPLAAAAVLAGVITLLVVRSRSHNNDATGNAASVTTAAAVAASNAASASTAATVAAATTNPAAASASATATSTAPAASPTTAGAAAATTTATAAPATTATTATASGAVAATGDDDVNLFTPVRWAVYSGGKVELLGNVPSKAIADDIATRAAAVVGAENVTVSYIIDPTAPLPKSAPLYVRDLILFDVDSAELRPGANQLLDLGVVLMQNNPAVKIRVLGRADSRGDPATNVQLSLARAKSVINYVAARGIDPSRLTPVALGAEAPVADNTTDEGMQQNRSVGFVITGFVS